MMDSYVLFEQIDLLHIPPSHRVQIVNRGGEVPTSAGFVIVPPGSVVIEVSNPALTAFDLHAGTRLFVDRTTRSLEHGRLYVLRPRGEFAWRLARWHLTGDSAYLQQAEGRSPARAEQFEVYGTVTWILQ
jgi:hypothetical protein